MLFVVASLPDQRRSWDTRGRLDDEERDRREDEYEWNGVLSDRSKRLVAVCVVEEGGNVDWQRWQLG